MILFIYCYIGFCFMLEFCYFIYVDFYLDIVNVCKRSEIYEISWRVRLIMDWIGR